MKSRKKVLRVFLLAIHSHLYSFALRFLFLQTHTTYYNFRVVKEKGGKSDRKSYPFSNGFRNPYRILKIMLRNLNEKKVLLILVDFFI
jgi:hypothetical protein